jgi:hypothetical protein
MHDMARIVITTFSSIGDLNPFVAHCIIRILYGSMTFTTIAVLIIVLLGAGLGSF